MHGSLKRRPPLSSAEAPRKYGLASAVERCTGDRGCGCPRSAVPGRLVCAGPSRTGGEAQSNRLGPGIERASDPDCGPGGSWSTCTNGCARDPPQDVAHVQFLSRIAWKLVWCPPAFDTFVLVDDEGELLAQGAPRGSLPAMRERQANFQIVTGSKYARAAEQIGAEAAQRK